MSSPCIGWLSSPGPMSIAVIPEQAAGVEEAFDHGQHVGCTGIA
jgi:hypothetical protein